ncbi:MAG: sigma-70 family RNA polymerase sigma factor [Blastocatellia bacterium]|nr:sigma-70 family RNA polymerase sigma factor [Blastocatellia bacterium]
MTLKTPDDLTQLLLEWSNGNAAARDKLMPVVYDELRRLASYYLRAERVDHTLQTTALVHEAYLRLINWQNIQWQNRAHFFALAAHIMRNILVDHARANRAVKRGGWEPAVTLDQAAVVSQEWAGELLALHDALAELELLAPQQSRIVELRFFGGLTVEETAEVLKVSPRTVKREWSTARAWLLRELTR